MIKRKRKVAKKKLTKTGKTKKRDFVIPLSVKPYSFSGSFLSKKVKKVKKSNKKMKGSVSSMAKKKKSKKRYFKNPIAGSMKGIKSFGKDTQKLVVDGAMITGGFLGMSVIDNFLPVTVKANDYLKLGVKLGIAVVTGMLLGKVASKDVAVKVSSGMAVNVVVDGLNTFKLTRFIPIAPTTTGALPAPSTTGSGVIAGNKASSLGVILNKQSM